MNRFVSTLTFFKKSTNKKWNYKKSIRNTAPKYNILCFKVDFMGKFTKKLSESVSYFIKKESYNFLAAS